MELWPFPILARLQQKVDPVQDRHLFRPLDRAYDGNSTFWALPSPEPDLDHPFWDTVKQNLHDEPIQIAAVALAKEILRWEPDPKKIVFAAILRAGVPIADWLCRLLPGSSAAAISLFVGLGPDSAAIDAIGDLYPDRKLVFVDGWTGKGGVAREIRKWQADAKLAVLIDPWGWADFAGCREDLFCPTACFTGLATLGFSRTFTKDNGRNLYSAYRFPEKYHRKDLIRTWQNLCPGPPLSPVPAEPEKLHIAPFFQKTDLRLHTNEVCRALINAAPETLYFRAAPSSASSCYPLLHLLAERRGVPIKYDARFLRDLKTHAACTLKTDG